MYNDSHKWKVFHKKLGKFVIVNAASPRAAADIGERILGLDPFTAEVEEFTEEQSFWDPLNQTALTVSG